MQKEECSNNWRCSILCEHNVKFRFKCWKTSVNWMFKLWCKFKLKLEFKLKVKLKLKLSYIEVEVTRLKYNLY